MYRRKNKREEGQPHWLIGLASKIDEGEGREREEETMTPFSGTEAPQKE